MLQKNIIEGRWYKRISCRKCLSAFLEDEFINDEFIRIKMQTQKLSPAAKSTFRLCLVAEQLMEKHEYQPIKNDFMLNEILRIISLEELFSFSDFNTHSE